MRSLFSLATVLFVPEALLSFVYETILLHELPLFLVGYSYQARCVIVVSNYAGEVVALFCLLWYFYHKLLTSPCASRRDCMS